MLYLAEAGTVITSNQETQLPKTHTHTHTAVFHFRTGQVWIISILVMMRASWRNVLHQIHMSDVTTNTTTTTAAVKSTRWHEHILLIIKSRKTGHVVLCSQSLCFYLHLKCSKQWLSLTVPVHYINALSSYYLQEVFFFFFFPPRSFVVSISILLLWGRGKKRAKCIVQEEWRRKLQYFRLSVESTSNLCESWNYWNLFHLQAWCWEAQDLSMKILYRPMCRETIRFVKC